MSPRLLGPTVLFVSCLVPTLAAQSAIDASMGAGGALNSNPTKSVVVGGGAYGSTLLATSASDDFNRPNSTNMGPDWNEVSGDMAISNNMGIGNTKGYMIHTSASSNYAKSLSSVDFYHNVGGSGLVYLALIAAYNPAGDFLFIKVQDNNSDGQYDRVYFYKNDNGGSWGASPYYFDLATPTSAGRMTLGFDATGDVATLGFDYDLNGTIDEVFEAGGILSSGLNLGTGFGIATYNNNPRFDNWSVNETVAFASDPFNRPDNTNMGPDWLEVMGDVAVASNMGISNSKGYMVHTSLSTKYAGSSTSVDFFHNAGGSGLVYLALIAGYNPAGDFLFVKVQDNNSDGLYDRVFFYKNDNGGSWGASPYFFDLTTPTKSGRMILSFDNTGDVAYLEFDYDFNGSIDDAFKAGNILSAGLNLGTGFGIATFGNQERFDNWSVSDLGWVNYGKGTKGTLGIPTLTMDASPRIGTKPNLVATSSSKVTELSLLFVGFKQVSIPGFWGGNLYVAPVATVGIKMPHPGWQLTLPIPNIPSLVGFVTDFQFLQADSGIKIGAASSPGLEMTIQP